MSEFFLSILNRSIAGGYVILVVLLVRFLLKYAPKAYSCALWYVVWFRLLCPFSPKSAWSLLLVRPQTVPADLGYMAVPEIRSGIGLVDRPVNALLPAATPCYSYNPMQAVIDAGTWIWAAGAVCLFGFTLISFFMLHRSLAGAQKKEKGVYVAENLRTPFVIGIFRPRIYLPAGLTEEEKDCILCHERMHIHRGDTLVRGLAWIALCLHWFHPLAWAAFYLMGRDMEMACDEAVIRRIGEGRKKEYSGVLLSLAVGKRFSLGTPLAFGEGEVKGRIRNLLSYQRPGRFMAAILLAAVAVLGIGLALNPKETEAARAGSGREETMAETDSVREMLERAWEWRTPYVGNVSAVGNITDSWYTLADASKNGFELYTDEEPYGVRIRYRINDSSGMTPETIYTHYSGVLEENAGILFALVENLGYVEISFDGEAVYRLERESYEEAYGNLWEQSETLDGLSGLYQKMNERAGTITEEG